MVQWYVGMYYREASTGTAATFSASTAVVAALSGVLAYAVVQFMVAARRLAKGAPADGARRRS